MKLSTCIEEYLCYKRAQRLSPNTLRDYLSVLNRFQSAIGEDVHIEDINIPMVRGYLAALDVSKKRVKNIHTVLSSLWTWAVTEGVCDTHILHSIKPPRPEQRVIVPFTKQEIDLMLDATRYSLPYRRPGKRECQNRLNFTLRDQLIILFLLDTGVRGSELCGIRMDDLGNDSVYIRGKGAKDRIVPVSAPVRKSLDKYLKQKKRKHNDPVFLSSRGKQLNRDSLRLIIYRISRRAGVVNAYPHRFRHTFAINFLRNGGDVFSLQRILGHSTLDMVKRYLAIARSDIQIAHMKASPVLNWNLDISQ